MADFPQTVDATTTDGVLPPDIRSQKVDVDPRQIYVKVIVPGEFNSREFADIGATCSETYYRLSDLIDYILASAKEH